MFALEIRMINHRNSIQTCIVVFSAVEMKLGYSQILIKNTCGTDHKQIQPDLQSGPKVLDHSGVFIRDFPRSPFLMLIYTILEWMPLLSATLRQG